ncbi:recombinase family protein [Streptomyces sp. FR-108]|uniref:recombinase family protein n=1 Tax=Streptomyces sp. FR-108 TaxID=3416665 RepID=UPI003CF9AC5E
MKRALGVIRLSVGNVNQTGEDTQRRKITNRVIADELELADFAVDIDVSASFSPWDRPQLGRWLNERADDFDVLYVYKMDRIIRSNRDLVDLLDWLDAHGKSLVSVEEGFDFSTTMGRMVAKLLSVIAEAELDAIKERIRNSRVSMRAQGRWPGGLVPFGRVAVPAEDGDGYTLKLCPTYGPWLLKVVEKFLKIRSFSGVAEWLNSNGVPTSQDIARMRAAEAGSTNTRLSKEKAKPRGSKWTATSVQAVLTNRNLLGEYVRADGTVERNPDGTPILRSVPVMTPEEFDELQEVIATVKYAKGTKNTSPLLGVLFCKGCEQPLYFVKASPDGSKKARFRCQGNKSKGVAPCGGQSYQADKIMREVEYVFLHTLGAQGIREKVKTSDDKTAVALAVLEGRIDQLNREFKAGRHTAAEFAEMMAQTAQEHEKVSQEPGRVPTWTYRDTGLTFSQWWTQTEGDQQARREKLTRWQIKIERGSEGLWWTIGDRVQTEIKPSAMGRPAYGFVGPQHLDKLRLAV